MSKSGLLSRRGFLAASAAATAGVSVSFAQSEAMQARLIPQAISALPNLSGQARPFTNAERQARIERARGLMLENKIDAIVLANSTMSSVYFANMRLGGGERLWALVIPAKSDAFVVCPAFEEGRAREMLNGGPLTPNADVLTWQEDQSPYEGIARVLTQRRLGSGTIGLDENMKFVFADGIRAAMPHAHMVSATPVTAGCRMIKEPHEIECMRLACRATLLVYRAVAQSVHPGMTNGDVERLVDLAYSRVGFRGDASLNIDEFTALPHGSRQPQTLKEGSILMLDDGCTVEGYNSDITRTFVLGKPTAKQAAVFDLVKKAQTAALHAARPGVLAADVDAAARKVIEDGGYGPGFAYFTHRVGHGIGLEGHEWPYFVKNDMYGWALAPQLKSGMTLSDEPGVYIKGEFGVRIEDELLVTENGAELLTPQSPSLEDPFGDIGA
ncbi:M24 family metallopeptidase [Occallatibacter riparius]|uniref:Xaa-Pro peptidase family protein n=1 Tax=Occallatibacter riparius TaxID=1002689 RepID=A0A9J7BSU1_9BACT|nr:Xaa-Pro peptidase family protein [Occallatibacter riparius]UWZ85963.1 Xaa-Pro peptidase family protein [Occallatibacter riparius]